MNHQFHKGFYDVADATGESDTDSFAIDSLDIKGIISTLRRRIGIIISIVILFLTAGIYYLLITKPVYEASATILITPRQQAISSDFMQRPSYLDILAVNSEIEIIKSSELLKSVVPSLDFLANPELLVPSLFGQARQQVQQWIYDLLKIPEEEIVEDKQNTMHMALKSVKARRLMRTYAIRVSFSSTDPERAAEITNAIVKTYMDDKLETRFAAAKHANSWLRERLSKLQAQVIEADRAVGLYKAKHDIFDTSTGLMTDQQLSELNSHLIIARSESATAKARLDRITFILESRDATASVEDALNNAVINNLRDEFAKWSRIASKMKKNQGTTHLGYLNAKAEIRRIEVQILAELRRIAQSYESSYEIARSREKSLEKSLNQLKGEYVFSGQKQVKLRELKRDADAKKGLYEKLLSSFGKANIRETFPTVGARIIEYAEPPNSPISPNKKKILLLSLLGGLAAGIGLAFFREHMDSFVWTPNDLERIFPGYSFGMLPDVKKSLPVLHSRRPEKSKGFVQKSSKDKKEKRVLDPKDMAPYHELLSDRLGYFAETLRNIMMSLRLASEQTPDKGAEVITFQSTMQGEGKSTVSLLQSLYLAKNGKRTLLIDSDFRKPSLTRTLTPGGGSDISALTSSDKRGLHSSVWRDQESGLDFLPVFGAKLSVMDIGAADLIAKGELSRLIDIFRADYDYILIDLPPILVLPDARALAASLGSIIYVVEWGKIEKKAIIAAIKNSPEIAEHVIGYVFNKVDIDKIRKYGNYYGFHYYNT